MSDENDIITDDGEEIKEDAEVEEGLEEGEVEKKKGKKVDDEDWDKLPNEGAEETEENELDKENW